MLNVAIFLQFQLQQNEDSTLLNRALYQISKGKIIILSLLIVQALGKYQLYEIYIHQEPSIQISQGSLS